MTVLYRSCFKFPIEVIWADKPGDNPEWSESCPSSFWRCWALYLGVKAMTRDRFPSFQKRSVMKGAGTGMATFVEATN